ncbi:tetratricopeptide repeat family protein, partial [Vibrio parahaemolyticus AQ3810]
KGWILTRETLTH